MSALRQTRPLRHMGGEDVERHMRDRVVRLYAEAGYTVEQDAVDAMIDAWWAHWFERFGR